MKTVIRLFIALLLLTQFADAKSSASTRKDDSIPDEVKINFRKKYPDVKSAEWKIMENEQYEAVFKEKGKTVEAVFDTKGNYISTKTEIKKKDIPSMVEAGLVATEYNTWEIVNALFIETASLESYYILKIRNADSEKELALDMQGNPVEK